MKTAEFEMNPKAVLAFCGVGLLVLMFGIANMWLSGRNRGDVKKAFTQRLGEFSEASNNQIVVLEESLSERFDEIMEQALRNQQEITSLSSDLDALKGNLATVQVGLDATPWTDLSKRIAESAKAQSITTGELESLRNDLGWLSLDDLKADSVLQVPDGSTPSDLEAVSDELGAGQ